MKNIRNFVNGLRPLQIATALVYAFALAVLAFVIPAGNAQAQSGNIYAVPQAQVAGHVWEAVVLQVSIKEVEASTKARTAGAGAGAAVGVLLASRSRPEHRLAANTVGALLGGLFGERTANAMVTSYAQEIIVRYTGQNGTPRTVVIVQPEPFDPVVPMELVYVSEVRGAYRVLKRTL